MRKELFFIVLAALLMAACGDGATKETLKKLNSSYEMDGQQVELVGYLAVPRSLWVRDGEVAIGLYSVAGQGTNGEPMANLRMRFGQEANSVWVPEKYNGSEMEIYDSEGAQHGYMKKVKVTGTVRYTAKASGSETAGEYEDDPRLPASINEMRRKSHERQQQQVDERVAKTGDANDYSFVVEVDGITLP